MDSIYASPEDFHQMKHRDKIRGLHLLEYFVNQCHQLGVIELGYCSESLLIFICCEGSIWRRLPLWCIMVFMSNFCCR
jgi:hypothetical protein